jgi:ATP-dependent helicase HrpA
MGTSPRLVYPASLPISQRVDEIAAAIRDHQVVIVAGETGSGKTTQLPKICLQLGRGRHGMIGHTQPRRLAARTVADRIATELGEELGATVGYQVRFTDQVGEASRVKLMTDGILLAELAHDRKLRRYDTLIIDEAHERSLNIDFILGYLTRLLPERPDLKVVITSATIDPHRFAEHFSPSAPVAAGRTAVTADRPADTGPGSTRDVAVPVMEVSGRTYPVEVRYRPPDAETDQAQAICDAVTELAAEGPGDMLVFLSGEREIRDTADALRRLVNGDRALRDTEILPLFARLSLAEQHRVFAPHPGRRIVLATNVAETSLTVPGIRYVIDPGTARISRYSHRLKVQRLPIEPISQASAIQRAGRCGRVAKGICIRLYDEEDFAARPTFTEPEILRTNLASVILQMVDLRLGDVADFPFLDPPDRRQVTDGIRLLDELGALKPVRMGAQSKGPRTSTSGPPEKGAGTGQLRLTPIGRKLARLPVDPRLARMVLEADRNGCLREVTVIAAALSIQDPRERPADRREAADALHARFADERSDFLAYLNLWHHLQDKQKELSSSRFRRLCRDEHLNYLRVREWQDIHQQLRRTARTLGASLNSQPADPQQIHTALLAGLLSHIGVKDLTATDPRRRHEFLGARGARFAIAPGSVLFKKSPQWVMVAELVETSRLWGRIAAAIQPEWVEPLAGHLVKRSYSEPHWETKRGSVVAYEKVTLYGVPVVPRRKVNYGRIDPVLSRELFIRHALVEGDWETHHRFFHDNQALRERVEQLEDRARRRDIVVDDEVLFEFFDRRVGEQVVSSAHFDRWWKQVRKQQPDLLALTMDVLAGGRVGAVSETDFPDTWRHGDLALPLTYQFEPGADADGVTVNIPLPLLGQVGEAGFDWQVPGLRRDLVIALIRSLPKPVRRDFVPVPDVADEVLAHLKPYEEPVLPALARALSHLGSTTVRADTFDLTKVPGHLRMTFRVTDDEGAPLAEGTDLATLRTRLRSAAQDDLSAAAAGVERRGLRQWDIGTLPHRVDLTQGGHPVTAYPALVDAGDHVDVKVFDTEEAQRDQMIRGTRRLLLLTCPSPVTYVSGRLSDEAKLVLLRNPHGGVRALLDDCAGCAVDAIVAEQGGPAWDEAGFDALRTQVRAQLNRATLGVVTEVLPVMSLAHTLEDRLQGPAGAALAPAIADMRAHLAGLIHAGFVTEVGWQRLPDLLRYLQAIERRLDKLPTNPERDRQAMDEVHEVWDEFQAAGAPAQVRWMIEELRVSLFAQQLGTPYRISAERIYQVLDEGR